ncbi:transporter substrate-binding domain-containing protein [Marinobacter sp. CHS3-4]|uniref:substrate-binding periplasmic protein n=1 Tax=Marinobacter sp. CHS3-4 TaxID=3045174 RepID=UPI0024B616D2|nr:transporter substrate-binding domain-containing protein [Marinobacter sp. CHS3-4]MDI9246056.1 transporter substrate-binding domain-containing protein [Marinobacter sp. CHS3-4]
MSWSAGFFFITFTTAMAEIRCKNLVVSGNPEYPPLLWQDRDDPGSLIGVVPALLKEIVEPMGVTVEVRHVGSWARVQHQARAGELDMVAGAFMTSERFTYMDYILPPILQLPTTVWVPAGQEFLYRHWPDLLGKTGSTLIDNSFGQNFDRYADENLNIVPVRSIRQSFLMAQAGRVDYVLYEKLQGQAKLAREGKEGQFTALEPPISSEGLFFTFPKKSPCNNFDFREAVADKLYKLVQDGRVEELIAEYNQQYVLRN